MLAQITHAAGESASLWTTDRDCLSICASLLANDDEEETPTISKEQVRDALDPVTGWCHVSLHTSLPHDTHAVILAARDEAHLLELSAKLEAARRAEWNNALRDGIPFERHFPKHLLIREPDAPYNGAATALGIYPTQHRHMLKKLLSTLPLMK